MRMMLLHPQCAAHFANETSTGNGNFYAFFLEWLCTWTSSSDLFPFWLECHEEREVIIEMICNGCCMWDQSHLLDLLLGDTNWVPHSIWTLQVKLTTCSVTDVLLEALRRATGEPVLMPNLLTSARVAVNAFKNSALRSWADKNRSEVCDIQMFLLRYLYKAIK